MSTDTEVKLLTLLNVAAIKKPRDLDIPGGQRGSPSLNSKSSSSNASPAPAPALKSKGKGAHANGNGVKKRKSVIFGGELGPSGSTFGKKAKANGNENGDVTENGKGKGKGKEVDGQSNGNGEANPKSNGRVHIDLDEGSEDETAAVSNDRFNEHFGASPELLTTDLISSVDGNEWKSERTSMQGFGRAMELRPSSQAGSSESRTRITPAIAEALKKGGPSPLVSTCLGHLGNYRDIYLHSLDGEADGSEKVLYGDNKEAMRKASMAHSLNHVLKTRRKIIRNNERLAHLTAADPSAAPEPPRDQSFTRPKVLLLLPVRSLALHYLTSHLFPLAPHGTQIENMRPFMSSFSIPNNTEDPLASTSATAEYALDHLVNFRGNSDDNFRIGIKITRKAWRIVMMPANESKLMECDILIASPLGVKMQSEREDSTDLLSSIEVAVVDGLDVMQMQNWDHVQFVFSHLNKMPKSPHGCDFSRVKPWYLDEQAKYLRQTILLSRYDTPETRSLFHKHCFNLEGKVRLEKNDYPGVLGYIKPGVKQVFERFDGETRKGLSGDAAIEEVDQRLDWFVKKTLPALQRSAISRQNTLIVVPSYFDYVRLNDYLRRPESKISYAAISEYSSNSEISRARTTFFKGKKDFLIVTERFHFYRRYKLRGAKTIVYYSLPEHAQFYSEFAQTPFLPSRKNGEEVEADVEAVEVSTRVLFSRFDAMKLERVVGSVDARRMLGSGEERFVFA